MAAQLAEVDRALDRIVTANEPAVLPQDRVVEINELARRVFEDDDGGRFTLVTPEEAAILAIPRGNLTEQEIDELRSHVVHTWEFLRQIPWTREFRRIPEIARSHHEKLDGSGYPYGMTGDQIPVQSRIMTIADIYDALDNDLFDLFLAARVRADPTPSAPLAAPSRRGRPTPPPLARAREARPDSSSVEHSRSKKTRAAVTARAEDR